MHYLTLLQHKNEKTTGFWKLSSSYQVDDDWGVEMSIVDSVFEVEENALTVNMRSQADLSLGLKF